MKPALLTLANPKTQKGVRKGYLTAVLHLAPHTLAGVGNVCPYASAGCIAACLNTAGRGGIFKAGETSNAIQRARIRRTHQLMGNREGFLNVLERDISRARVAAERIGLRLAIRLNGTSDLRWHKLAPQLFERFPSVQFYDYTKDAERMRAFLRGELPRNYYLTFSRSESNGDVALSLASQGASVAIVTHLGNLKGKRGHLTSWQSTALWDYRGAKWVDGDAHDLRFLDPSGALVLLSAKGRAKRDVSGFVVR